MNSGEGHRRPNARSKGLSLAQRAFDGAAFTLAANVIKQCIGVVSMFVLARLLAPGDYGIVALSTLTIHFFDVFSQIGTKQYVLSRKQLAEHDLDTAWTLQLLVRLALALAVIISASSVSAFFEVEQLRDVLFVSALIPLLNSLQAPGVMLLQREFDYKTMSLVTVTAKAVSSGIAVALAVWLRSYWALVAGDLVFAALMAWWSYKAHAKRPRVCLVGWRKQWSFSKWMLARALLGFTRSKVDTILIGKFVGVFDLGLYNFGKHIASMPQQYLTEPLSDIFTSGIARSSSDGLLAGTVVTRILTAQVSLFLPILAGTAMLAEMLVGVLLGPKWHAAAGVITALASLSLSFSLSTSLAVALVAIERVRLAFWVDVFGCGAVVVSMGAAVSAGWGLEPIAWLRAELAATFSLVFYIAAATSLPLAHGRLLLSTLPSVLATAVMIAVIMWSQDTLANVSSSSLLLCLCLLGLVSYTITFVLVLSLCRKASPETEFLWQTLSRVVAKMSGALRRSNLTNP